MKSESRSLLVALLAHTAPGVSTRVMLAAATLLLLAADTAAQQRDSIHGTALTATPAVAALLDPFRGGPDSAEVAEVLDRRRRFTGFPRSAEDHVLVARLWERAGEPDLAVRKLDGIRQGESGPLDALERARVLLGTDRDRAAGAAAWWAACETIDAVTKTEVSWDILPLTTPEERDEWDRLAPGEPTCGWLHRFWSARAQRMALPSDARLALHYRRLAHVREWYRLPEPYFFKGTADYHGRPDGLAMDDRGLVYVRMGAPLTDEGFTAEGAGEARAGLESTTSDGGASTTALEQGSGSIRRCWPYWRTGGYRIYCFAGGRLTGGVPGRPGTRFYQQYVLNSNLPKSVFRNRSRNVGGGLQEGWERALRDVERRAFERHGIVRTRENIEEALEQIPDVPEVRANVRLRVETLRFLNPSRRQWQVWTLASVRAGDLAPAENGADGTVLSVGGRYSLLGPDGVRIEEFTPARLPAGSIPDDAGITLKSVVAADPGRLPLTVVVEDLNEPKAGNYYQDSLNIPAIGGLPQLSDIAVARAEGGTWTRDGQTFLRVSPTHVTNADGSIHTYFEVYGVDPARQYDVEFRLAPVDVAERIWRLEPDDLGFRLQFTSEMTGEIGRHHLRLDLGDTEPGEYTLAVRIRETETQAYSLPAVTDVFVAER